MNKQTPSDRAIDAIIRLAMPPGFDVTTVTAEDRAKVNDVLDEYYWERVGLRPRNG